MARTRRARKPRKEPENFLETLLKFPPSVLIVAILGAVFLLAWLIVHPDILVKLVEFLFLLKSLKSS